MSTKDKGRLTDVGRQFTVLGMFIFYRHVSLDALLKL